jgi:hypothetical protein
MVIYVAGYYTCEETSYSTREMAHLGKQLARDGMYGAPGRVRRSLHKRPVDVCAAERPAMGKAEFS